MLVLHLFALSPWTIKECSQLKNIGRSYRVKLKVFMTEQTLQEDVSQPTQAEQHGLMPLLPLRDVVVYPHLVIPLFVGRTKSVKALEIASDGNKQILLVAQKSANKEDRKSTRIRKRSERNIPLRIWNLKNFELLVEKWKRCRADLRSRMFL